MPLAGLIIVGRRSRSPRRPGSRQLRYCSPAKAALLERGASYTVEPLVLLVACKGPARAISLSSFRGGPTFLGMLIGAAGGIALSTLPGLPTVAGARSGSAR